MGYYSTVRMLATKKAAKKIFTAIKYTDSPFDEIKVSPSGKTYYFEAYTKWYEDDPKCFPEVDAVMKTLDKLDDDEFIYIRVGEEDGDIDRLGSGDETEANIYTDDKDDCIDAWRDVSKDGKTIESSPVERLTPFWEEFKKKAEMFGITITKKLPEIID